VRSALSISLALCSALLAQNTGSIQGSVVDARTQQPLSGALVIARAAASASAVQSVKAAVDGSFLLQNLAPGKYSVCVKAGDSAHLDPCDWGQATYDVTLGAGQKSLANHVAVPLGSVVKIRIQDTSQWLFQKTKTGFVPDLLVGAFDPHGIFYPASVVNRDIRGLNLELVVPFDTPLALSVASKAAKLADSNGIALPAGASQTAFQCASADSTARSFLFTVTGIIP
jgi:hypothetical protein